MISAAVPSVPGKPTTAPMHRQSVANVGAASPLWWPRLAVMALLMAAAGWAAHSIRLETELLA